MTELTLPLTNITHWNAYGEIFTLEFFLWKNHAEFFAKIASLRLYCFNCSSTHTLNTIGGNWKPRGIRQIIFPLANATQLPLTVSEGKENTQAEKHEGNFLLCAINFHCFAYVSCCFFFCALHFDSVFFLLFYFFSFFWSFAFAFCSASRKKYILRTSIRRSDAKHSITCPMPQATFAAVSSMKTKQSCASKNKKKKPKTCKNKKVYMKKMKSVEETSWPTAPNCTYFLLKLVKLGENRLHTYKNELWAFFIV